MQLLDLKLKYVALVRAEKTIRRKSEAEIDTAGTEAALRFDRLTPAEKEAFDFIHENIILHFTLIKTHVEMIHILASSSFGPSLAEVYAKCHKMLLDMSTLDRQRSINAPLPYQGFGAQLRTEDVD